MLLKDWSIRREPAALLLGNDGSIGDCTSFAEDLFAYPRAHLITRPVDNLIPRLAELPLMLGEEPNPKLLLLCNLGTVFEARRRDGKSFNCYLSVSQVGHEGERRIRLTVIPRNLAWHK